MKETIDLYSDGIGRVQYISHMGNDKTIVNAARVSFGNDNEKPLDKRDQKLINYLLKNKHTSPFEHCTITWKFVVPLFVRGQHHRHRTWAYNEVSRRYTSENLQFYLPKIFRTQHEKDRQASNSDVNNPMLECYVAGLEHPFYNPTSWHLEQHVRQSISLYEKMLQSGVCREQARMVLPQNMYTEYYGTVNLHNAMHFMRLRADSHAQWEIRRVAEAMREHLDFLYPVAMEAFGELQNV